ncbi:hypothetical protein Cni_G21525 [Canna indica]|uniref:Uncharacterized protein n=1 Tax=Canna indica TaxID=4628 RepID=A0AAQ3KTB3_9LILI|nr:hypothetical protein Cni_G21525 [Canna indica]
MYFELLSYQTRITINQIEVQALLGGLMEGRVRRNELATNSDINYSRTPPHEPDQRCSPSTYFSMESFLLLILLTASLLILPLILPPLPPPPSMLLLLPIGLLIVLLVLAFMPSDVWNVASSYL